MQNGGDGWWGMLNREVVVFFFFFLSSFLIPKTYRSSSVPRYKLLQLSLSSPHGRAHIGIQALFPGVSVGGHTPRRGDQSLEFLGDLQLHFVLGIVKLEVFCEGRNHVLFII